MALRHPRTTPAPSLGHGTNPLEYEILQEKAAALGHAASQLKKAMGALEDFDAEGDGPLDEEGTARQVALVARAGEALWNYAVQRELCGFLDLKWVLEEYRIPNAVWLRMAPNSALGSRQLRTGISVTGMFAAQE